jgi:hypothetical protein
MTLYAVAILPDVPLTVNLVPPVRPAVLALWHCWLISDAVGYVCVELFERPVETSTSSRSFVFFGVGRFRFHGRIV